MDLTPGIKELHIISYNVSWFELVGAYIVTTGTLIAIAFGIYDHWFK